MNLGTTQFGFSLVLRLQPDLRPSMTPRVWITAYVLGFQQQRRQQWRSHKSCHREGCCYCQIGLADNPRCTVRLSSTMYQGSSRQDALRTGYSGYCGSSKEHIGTSSRLRSLPCAMRQLRCAKIFVWPIWPRAMTKSRPTRDKIGVSTRPGSVVIHVHDEDGVRTKPGESRRLKINLSLMTGRATCV